MFYLFFQPNFQHSFSLNYRSNRSLLRGLKIQLCSLLDFHRHVVTMPFNETCPLKCTFTNTCLKGSLTSAQHDHIFHNMEKRTPTLHQHMPPLKHLSFSGFFSWTYNIPTNKRTLLGHEYSELTQCTAWKPVQWYHNGKITVKNNIKDVLQKLAVNLI